MRTKFTWRKCYLYERRNMTNVSFLLFLLLGYFIELGDGLKCYRCFSNQEGCGKELSIRLNRLEDCPGLPYGAGENFCVKVINKRGSDEFYLRECLSVLRENAYYRSRLPTVQRHGYCEPARNNDPHDMFNEDSRYCFCNDWNGCNGATAVKLSLYTGLIAVALGALFKMFSSGL